MGALLGLKAIPWKLVGAVALIVVISLLVWRGDHYQKRAARFEAQLDTAIEVANSNAAIATAAVERANKFAEIAGKNVEVKRGIRAASDAVRAEIRSAPPTDDGAIAPVLRRQLDRLPIAQTHHKDCSGPARHSLPGIDCTNTVSGPAGGVGDPKGRRAGVGGLFRGAASVQRGQGGDPAESRGQVNG